jgi:ribonuclease D
VSEQKRKPPSPPPGSENGLHEHSSNHSDEALARLALREVAASERAPASARAAAARTLLEASGLIGRLQEKPRNSKGLNEMTREELEAEIARLRAPGSEPADGEDDPFALSP